MVPSREVPLHGPGASWGPAAWRGEPRVPQHSKHTGPHLEGGCCPDVTQMSLHGHNLLWCGTVTSGMLPWVPRGAGG